MILVDFRGFDTLGEIAVLARLGIADPYAGIESEDMPGGGQ